ncbi:MAG: hypothetical protein LBP92_00290 [Deltaproteobacteria bacterium]|jgi:hypothetical protein|nr:hypothetical protein [Deltaproteobacteria bacterium]
MLLTSSWQWQAQKGLGGKIHNPTLSVEQFGVLVNDGLQWSCFGSAKNMSKAAGAGLI